MFAERVKEILNSKGITQKTMLEDLNLGKNQFSYWNKTGATPNGFTVEKIAKYLDVSVDYLLGKTEERKKPSPEPVLTEREKAILEIFRSLPEEKQDKLIELLENM